MTRAAAVLLAAAAGCGGGGGADDAAPAAADAAVTIDAPGTPDAPPIDAALDALVIDAIPPVDGLVCEVGDAGVPHDPDIGFAMPTEVTRAYEEIQGVWTDMGPADWSCLGTPSDDVPSSVAITLSGSVSDFQTGNAISFASIEWFADSDVSGTPVDSTMSDVNGEYTATLPAGVVRPAVAVTHQNSLDTYYTNIAVEPDQTDQTLDVFAISMLTANALPAFIGLNRTPGLGLGVWTVHDCNGRTVKNAIATVSAGPQCPVPLSGALTFYFSAGSTSLPVRHSQRASTNDDGLFMVIEAPPTADAYVQVWGYTDGQVPGVDGLRRLAEIPVVILADSFMTADLEPRRAD